MRDYAVEYLQEVQNILTRVLGTQTQAIHTAATWLVDAALGGKKLWAVGCGHAGLLAQELFYRSGGLVVLNPLFAPGLQLDVSPVTLTSDIERIEGYGAKLIDRKQIGDGDVLIVHSVSGRNPAGIDMALRARERGAKVIALTNMAYSQASTSRHSSGKRLFECADLVLDNCGAVGDAAVAVDGFAERTGPTSTAVGAAILNAMVCQTVAEFKARGVTPPVFVSANLEGGDAHNKQVMEQYKDQICYL